jgi:hypothetical protein
VLLTKQIKGRNKTMMRLTARQISAFDEICEDGIANELTLKAALSFHSNRENEILKAKKALWKELSETHGFDMDITHSIMTIDSITQVVQTEQN